MTKRKCDQSFLIREKKASKGVIISAQTSPSRLNSSKRQQPTSAPIRTWRRSSASIRHIRSTYFFFCSFQWDTPPLIKADEPLDVHIHRVCNDVQVGSAIELINEGIKEIFYVKEVLDWWVACLTRLLLLLLHKNLVLVDTEYLRLISDQRRIIPRT